ncbi:hypothetical protein KY289_003996 [Solanum tuberosum]|nr:hypothetical protein KY289_003996 [Solanum tuberosum]
MRWNQRKIACPNADSISRHHIIIWYRMAKRLLSYLGNVVFESFSLSCNVYMRLDLETDGNAELGFAKWFEELQSKPEKEATDRRKLVSKWHPTTKGTLRRNYRVPSKPEGKRLLKSIASLLSDDDHFRDATSHKGCQIRRESAHGESVCCNNVRALFDELPTPHLIVEITPFPAGPLTETDYAKAEKLERVLRSGPSV